MGAGQRNKGNAAEREVAALLTGWWRQVEPECEFLRTPSSGGWANAKVRGDMRASGDLMTTAERWSWAVEVKRREGWTLTELMKGHRSPVWEWWRQAQVQAEEMQVNPMLWLRRSREPWHVMIPANGEYPLDLPIYLWQGEQHLWGVNYGRVKPCLVMANDLLKTPANYFAR